MMKLSVGLFAAALVIGVGSVTTLTYAEQGAAEAAKGGSTEANEDGPKDESKLKQVEEEVLKDLEEDKDQPADTLMESEGADH